MPGKAKYWEHFELNGDIAMFKIKGCKGHKVSGRKVQKPVEAKKPKIGRSNIFFKNIFVVLITVISCQHASFGNDMSDDNTPFTDKLHHFVLKKIKMAHDM